MILRFLWLAPLPGFASPEVLGVAFLVAAGLLSLVSSGLRATSADVDGDDGICALSSVVEFILDCVAVLGLSIGLEVG
jgi:hypothetical protein